MRPPLIRQGGGPDDVLRIYDNLAQERQDLQRMIDTANATETQQELRRRGVIGARSAAGDEDRLRMIPAIARGVAGAIPGTAPHAVTSGRPVYHCPRT